MVPTMSNRPTSASRLAAVVSGMPWSCAAGMKCVAMRPLVLAPQIAKPPTSSQKVPVRDAERGTDSARLAEPPTGGGFRIGVPSGAPSAVVANRAARRCVVPPWHDGGQAQFIQRTVPQPDAASTGAAGAWALQRLHEPLNLAAMAAHTRMSVRSFTRRFREETGLSPSQWLIRQRVEHARLLLETTDLAVDEVARQAGFGTSVSLRQHLHAAVGVAPLAYRRTFRAAPRS
jgi:AraC-like DNA-binding protein